MKTEKCWYCFKNLTNTNNKHIITLNSAEILVCDYCLSRLANSYFNLAFNSNVDRKEVFLLALRYAKMIYNKNNLDNKLVKALEIPYTTLYYYLNNNRFEKLLAKISKP